jgi:hypothetical protein
VPVACFRGPTDAGLRGNRQIPFRPGDLRVLQLSAESLGCVLAWFSLIHTDPTKVPAILQSSQRPSAQEEPEAIRIDTSKPRLKTLDTDGLMTARAEGSSCRSPSP